MQIVSFAIKELHGVSGVRLKRKSRRVNAFYTHIDKTPIARPEKPIKLPGITSSLITGGFA
jgi:hypothetical protein